jgi:hypothetical protein
MHYHRSVLKEGDVHARALGFHAETAKHLFGLAARLSPEGQFEEHDDRPGGLITWRDAARAAMSIYVDADQAITCVIPFLEVSRSTPARLEKIDDSNRSCSCCAPVIVRFLLRDGSDGPEAALTAQDLEMNRGRIEIGGTLNIAPVLSARKWVVRSEGDPSPIKELGDAPTRWIPAGLMGLRKGLLHVPADRVVLRGKILETDDRLNRTTRERFQRARIEVEGIKLDAVAPLAEEPEDDQVFERGKLLEGSFCLVATLDPAFLDYTMPVLPRRGPTV